MSAVKGDKSKLTLDDLYGKSKPGQDAEDEEGKPEGQIVFNKHNEALVYEETPEISPLEDEYIAPEEEQPEKPQLPKLEKPKPKPKPVIKTLQKHPKKGSCFSHIMLYMVFFAIGILGALYWRNSGGTIPFLKNISDPTPSPEPEFNIQVGPEGSTESAGLAPTPTPTISPTFTPTNTPQPTPTLLPSEAPPPTYTPSPTPKPTPTIQAPQTVGGWETVRVGDKLGFSVGTITLQIPSDVKDLSCDPSGCASYGTELSGKTRFTVSFHRFSKPIINFELAKIVDAAGNAFPQIQVSAVNGKVALDYYGAFNGITTNGYGFTRMHGVMILLDQYTTMEINHFEQSGVPSDWNRDDETWKQIVKTVSIK